MLFAQMVANNEDAIICDFLQYYQVMEYRNLPLKRAAILACGLPADSRSMKLLSGTKYTSTELNQIAILDAIMGLQYLQKKAHFKGHFSQPKSLLEKLTKPEAENPTDAQGFDSPEAFEAARNKIING